MLGRTATRKVDLPKRSEVNTNVNESDNPDYFMYGLVVVSGIFLLFSGVKLFQNLAGKQKNSP